MTKNKQKIHIYGYKAIIFQFDYPKDSNTKIWLWKGIVEIFQDRHAFIGNSKSSLIKHIKEHIRIYQKCLDKP